MSTATLADGSKIELPTLMVGLMGHPGSGKSHFFASFPKPMLVLATDPLTKMMPYFERGEVDSTVHKGAQGQIVRLVKSRTSGGAIIQIEGFYDTQPTMPCAMQAFMQRIDAVTQEVQNRQWATVVLDSWSGLQDIAVLRRQYGPFAENNKDGRAAYAVAKDDVKQILVNRLVHLNCNVCISFHISEKVLEDGGTILYNVKAIGDLASTIGQNIAERYRSESTADGITRRLFTRPDGRFNLCTLIDAPNPCENTYQAVLKNWIAKRAAMVAAAAQSPSSVTEEFRAQEKKEQSV